MTDHSWIFLVCLALTAGVLLLPPRSAHAQSTIYVDADASGTNDGTSWDDAYSGLQDALDRASDADEIWIAEGTYYPDEGTNVSNDDADATFTITGTQNGLKIYGGFSGTEDNPGDRDPDAHPVTLSGDIEQNDGVFAPTVDSDGDGDTPTQTDHIVDTNSHHVVTFEGRSDPNSSVDGLITGATILSGVTITGGDSSGDFFDTGGGIFCRGQGDNNGCSPTLSGLTLKGNFAEEGAALYNRGRQGTLNESSPTITNSTFVGNAAGQNGGAIYNDGSNGGSSGPLIANCVFVNNGADTRGGAIYTDSGEGAGFSQPEIFLSTFFDNEAFWGGALYNSSFDGSTTRPLLHNSIFWGNDADGSGAGIYNDGSGNATTELIISHTLIAGGIDAISENGGSSTTNNGNILSNDPQFAGAGDPNGPDDVYGTGDDGMRLSGLGAPQSSPAIDAGTNNQIPGAINGDIAGNSRSVEGDGDGTATVDLGAYEYNGPPLPVELARFDARVAEAQVHLAWTTASETNNAGFAIQRRTSSPSGTDPSGNWTSVGFIEGHGTTDRSRTYRFEDADLPYEVDRLTYRLKQVDTDGTTALSDAITVERGTVTEVQLLGTFPNPARTRATVRYAIPEGVSATDVTMHLYDVLGRQVKMVVSGTQEGRHEQTLDVGTLPSGVYFLRLQAGGKTQTQKLTVVR
jgi:predicted outer membrane repeat protein